METRQQANRAVQEEKQLVIKKLRKDSSLRIILEKRLDTITAPDLEYELRGSMERVTDLVFDLSGLTYISSAGLRVLLTAQKRMNRQGSMLIENVRPEIMELLEEKGFMDILSIKGAKRLED